MGLIKFLMFTMNFVLWAIGGTLLGIGIWLEVDDTALDAVNIGNAAGMDEAIWNASVIIIIVVGALTFVVGFLGCLGAMQSDKKPKNFFLKLYFVSVKIIIILEIVSIILAAVFWGSINDSVRDRMAEDVKTKYVNETAQDTLSKSWNNLQRKWNCCGGKNYNDYHGSNYNLTTRMSVPWTCCVMKNPGSSSSQETDVKNQTLCRTEGEMIYNPTYPYNGLNPSGCYDSLKNEVESNSALIIGLCSGFIGLQIVGYIFACLLMRGGGN